MSEHKTVTSCILTNFFYYKSFSIVIKKMCDSSDEVSLVF